jgi:uncharacterized protein YkwD
MKLFTSLFSFFLIGNVVLLQAQSPIDKWSKQDLEKANTAKGVSYLSPQEKQVIFYWNLARINGKLFSETFLKHYVDSANIKNNSYLISLKRDLEKLNELPVINPNKELSNIAQLHAQKMGESGAMGHWDFTKRFKDIKPKYISVGECCQYGFKDPLAIVIDLLIDEGIADIAHRKIMLKKGKWDVAVSIKAHKKYRVNSVLDVGEVKNN